MAVPHLIFENAGGFPHGHRPCVPGPYASPGASGAASGRCAGQSGWHRRRTAPGRCGPCCGTSGGHIGRYPHGIPPDVSVYADGARPPALGDVPHTTGPIVQAVCPTVWACVLSHLLWDAHPAPAEAPPGRPCCARP